MKSKISNDKFLRRLRRARKSRAIIRRIAVPRLSVHKTGKHIYVQLILSEYGSSDRVLAQASSLESLDLSRTPVSGKLAQATCVGQLIAERVQALEIQRVAFDRSGFKYHGRIKALAEAARAGGLVF